MHYCVAQKLDPKPRFIDEIQTGRRKRISFNFVDEGLQVPTYRLQVVLNYTIYKENICDRGALEKRGDDMRSGAYSANPQCALKVELVKFSELTIVGGSIEL